MNAPENPIFFDSFGDDAACPSLAAALSAGAGRGNHALTFLDRGGDSRVLPYRELLARSRAIAAGLAGRGLERGTPAILCFDDDLALVEALWAVWLCGAVPAPLSAPAGYSAKDEALAKLLAVDSQCAALGQTPLILSDLPFATLAAIDSFREQIAPERFVAPATLAAPDTDWSGPTVAPDELALLMFSSGSTGDPKGVRLSHRQIMANLRQIREISAFQAGDRSLSWLPLTHDMGLILFHICHTLAGIPQYKMSPLAFARDPAGLLDLACAHGITLLGMPNFGYDQLLRAAAAADPHRWRLDQIRLIYNGAEPIDADLCRRFYDGLARFGLRRHSISPGWGIAEAAVVASGFTVAELGRWHDLPSAWIDRRAGLAVGHPVIHCPPGSPQSLEIVSLGPPLTGMSVRVLDDDGRELGPDRFGHLEIAGPNVSAGYFGQADVAWIATGDIGFVHDGRIHLTGRAKDVIFINGRNRFSNDIEADLCRELAWPANQLAVVGITDPERKVESIVVFFRAERGSDRQRTARRIRDTAERLLGYPVAGAIPLAGLPKTTSGKIRRFALRQGLLAGDYDRQLADAAALPGRPQTAGEAALAALVVPLLKTADTETALDPEAPLSRYGLDSVGFMQLAFAIARDRAVELTPPQLIGAATLAAIAALVAAAPAIPSDRETAGATAALTPRQQLLWTAWQLEPDSRVYNETYGLRLVGAIDGERWRRAAEEVVAAQPMLRAHIVAGQEAQLALATDLRADIRVENCTDAELDARLEVLADAAFDLRRGPLARLCLLRGETATLLFVSAHHLIADGWSLHQLISRIFNRYRGAELPAAETLLWREAPRFPPERLAEAATAFRAGEPLQLPGEPDPDAVAVAQVGYTLAPDATAALRARRAATGSDFGALAAALLVLLGRLCDCRRPLLATVTSGRFDLRARDRFGYFARTQPLSADLDPEISFDALVAAIEPQRLAMLGGDTPDLAELELAGADLARKLRVVYVHQNLPAIAVGPELRIDGLIQHRSRARADLCVSSAWHGDRLEFTWEYDGQRLGRAQTLAYAELLEHVLRQLLAAPERPIGQLELLSPGQRRRWQPYGMPKDAESAHRDVIARIDDRIRRHPELTALSDRNERLSYAALGIRVDALCCRLEEAGIAHGDRVALLTGRSADYIVALLACLKMAAIAVPLDPGQPAERIGLILRESRADLILAAGGVEPTAAQAAGCRILSFTGADLVPGAAHPGRPADGADGAYLIFTSGSTGQPKGVLIPRGAFANLAEWVTAEFDYRPGETLCQFAPFSFDVSMAEILPSLCAGLHIHVLPDEHRASPALYLAALREQKAGIATVTPAYLAVLNESPAACREHLQSLRLLILGGEALLTEEVRRFREHSAHVAVVNVYGPTETTVLSTAYRVPADPDPRHAWQPLGRPIRATEVWILDAAGRVCPATVTGTLHIGGAGLARGYWNDPEKTARAFRPRDPDGRGERRFYDSGDLARLNSAGELEFVGRADTQIKLRGFRIELGEIEAVLARHPGVDQAVVCAPARDGGERALVAYYSGEGEPAALAEFLRTRLPAYMQPAAYVRMSAWPLNDNRKVDRARLPAPQWGARNASTAAAPATATETVLADIWSQLLGTAAISRHDNFALLGGSSIAAAQLVNRIRDRCGRELPLIEILRAADLAAMAAAVDRAQSADLPEPERGARPRPADLAASEAQARMVFLEHRHAGTALNTIPLTLALSAPVDPQRLRQAAAALAGRHWILRVGLTAGAAGVRQSDTGGVPDLRVVACADADAALEALTSFQQDSFDLMPGPLWRLALVSVAGGGCWLALNLHHAIADGVTLVRVLDELDALYRGEALPPVDDEFDYEDFRLWQERLLSGPWAERMHREWADPRRQCPPLPLPHPGGRREHVDGRQFVVDLDAGQTARLKTLCARHRVRPFQLMLAIFGFVLGQRCASRRFAVGITLGGRSRQAWERVPGLFVNTLPLTFDWTDDERFVDLLARLDERLAELQDCQDFPLNRVMAAQKRRDPPFEVLFNEEMLPPRLHFAGAPAELAAVGSGIAKMPLVVSFLLAGEPWRWRIEHRDDACPADWVADLNDEVKRLINLLDGMGEARLADLQAPDEHLMALLELP